MASQSTQRRPSNSTKPQPMRATMHFTLSTSKNRNPSPPRGSFARKPSPSSSPVLNEGSIKARRTSPETRTSPESRRSPTSPLIFISPKVERSKGSTTIRRTSSLDTLSGNYLSSQWPREICVGSPAAMVTKATQTPGWDESVHQPGEAKHQRSASWGSADNLKEKFRQHRQRTKQSSHLHGRQSPITGDHTAVSSLGTTSIPIPTITKTVLHARHSMEGLNSELQGFAITDGDDSVFRSAFEQIPDGHRAPLPRRSVNSQTQTPLEMFDDINNGVVTTSCQTSSPGHKSSECGRDSSSPDLPPGFKYASSPKPNNSYLFGREPPDGAEKVLLHMEEGRDVGEPSCVSAPDKTKGVIKFSHHSPFQSILPSKVAPLSSESTTCIH